MAWFRRRRTPTTAATDDRFLPVPVATATDLARTERALQLLAVQSADLHRTVAELGLRLDDLARAVADQAPRPTEDDVAAARVQSIKVAAELARLEVNLAARLDALRAEIRAVAGDAPADIDVRVLSPVDTGWSLRAG
jgi:hypothetical protein